MDFFKLNQSIKVKFNISYEVGNQSNTKLSDEEMHEIYLKVKMFAASNSLFENGDLNQNEENKEKSDKFIQLYKDIEESAIIAQKLYDCGYNIKSYLNNYKNSNKYFVLNQEKNKLGTTKILEELKAIESKWDIDKKKLLIEYPVLHKIYGSELIYLINKISKQKRTIRAEALIQVICPSLNFSSIRLDNSGNIEWDDQIKKFAEQVKNSVDNETINLNFNEEIMQNLDHKIILVIRIGMDLFTSAFIWSIINFIGGNLPKPENIFVYNKILLLQHLQCFLSQINANPSKVFYFIMPNNKNTQGNSEGVVVLKNFFLHSFDKQQFNGKLVIIQHDNLDSATYINPSLIIVKENIQLDKKKLENFITNHDTNHKTSIYTATRSGLGKSFEIKQKGRKICNVPNYIEITIGGHTNFAKWSNRILKLANTCSPRNIMINIVVGWPETFERVEEIQHFQCQVTLFLFMIIILRGYRCQFSNINFHHNRCKNLYFSIEISKSPAQLLEKNFELLKLFGITSISDYFHENLELGCDRVEDYMKFVVSNKEYYKLEQITYLFDKMEEGILPPLNFPLTTNPINLKQKKLIEEYLVNKLKENHFFPNNITPRIIYYIINLFFHEMVDFNACNNDLNRFAQKSIGFSSGLALKFQKLRIEAVINMLSFCQKYTVSKIQKVLENQDKVINCNKNMENQNKIEQFNHYMKYQMGNELLNQSEDDITTIVVFSSTNMILLFKKFENLSYYLKVFKLMSDYVKFQNERLYTNENSDKNNWKQDQFQDLPDPNNPIFKDYFEEVTDSNAWEKLSQVTGKNADSLKNNNMKFILTAHTLFKIVTICKKLRARVPVILMGETGTGKTFMIRFIAENLISYALNSAIDPDKFTGIFKYKLIHAGYSEEKLKKIIKKHIKMAEELTNEVLVVFLDEFNTSNYVNLLTSVICKHTFLGKPLPKKLIYTAACNPYVQRDLNKKNENEDNGLAQEEAQIKKAYTVNPLEEVAASFTMNVKLEEGWQESSIILGILKESKLSQDAEKFIPIFSKCIEIGQKMTRDREGASSVSLRDIKKCVKIFNWMLTKYFIEKDKMEKTNQNKIIVAAVCALGLAYYLRIGSKSEKQKFHTKISENLGQNIDFDRILNKEMKFVVDNLNLKVEIGISKNVAILENCFALFVCINIPIPILIVGKPGCSKTLSCKIITSSLQGKSSEKKFCQGFPQINVVYFQGSDTTMSEAIVDVFEKALEKKDIFNFKDNENPRKIVILIDELGLAEISPYNPLKVLHGYLDNYEKNDIGFVGISNWALDAAKNNRAVYVARTNLESEEINKLTNDIAASILGEDQSMKFTNIWKELADGYCRLIMEPRKTKIMHGKIIFLI